MPAKKDLPSTLQRSDDKAQRTYAETLESAEEQYGPGQRAQRTAWGALKHTHEKVGDHWEPKDHKGPSDEQSELTGAPARDGKGKGASGVDANATKAHLMDVARRLDVPGRSRMRKDELVEAIRKANDRETRRSRS